MKSVKKQNISKKNLKPSIQRQKKSNTDNSKSRIKSYFKPAAKSFQVEDEAKADQTEEPKQFYIQALKQRLQAIHGTEGDDSIETDRQNEIDYLNETDGPNEINYLNEMDGPNEIDYLNEMDGPNEMGGPNEMDVEQDKVPGDNLSPCCQCEQKSKDLVQIQEKYEQLSRENECEQKRCKEWQDKYKELKKVYVKLTVNYAELDSKHKDLLKTVTGKNEEKNEASAADEQTEDDDILTSGEEKFLECMPLDKKKDSTFVLQCLQFMYKNDPKIMATKSVKGTKDSIRITSDGEKLHIPGKEPLTPTKYIRIKQLFVTRISQCDINSAEYGERIKEPYVNKLLASGIKNMSK